MDYNNRRYLIIPSSIVNQIDFSQVMETSVDTLRYSIDETKTFVKYYVTVVEEDTTETYLDADTGEEVTVVVEAGIYGRPSIYNSEYPEYTHDEMLVVLEGEEWNNPIEN